MPFPSEFFPRLKGHRRDSGRGAPLKRPTECTYLKSTHVILLKISVIMPRVSPVAVKDVGVLYWPIESWPYPALPETGSATNNRLGIVNVCLDNGAVHITNPDCVRSPEYDVATMVTFPPCKAGSPPVH